jgi:hypothetical protein
LVAGAALAEGEAKWFDMENCGFCKHLVTDKGLLDHCVWENHKIAKGAVTVTTVEKEYLPAFRAAMKEMEATGKKMEAGEMVPMCGMCQSMGMLMMKGVKWESVDTQVGNVMLMEADTPELVAEIHAFVDKTNAELAKWSAAETPKGAAEEQ